MIQIENVKKSGKGREIAQRKNEKRKRKMKKLENKN